MHDEIKANWLSEIVRRFSIFVYTINGWTAVQENPPPAKAVIIAAPHTSNWDFLYFFGLTNKLNLQSYWIGKNTLFKWPWGNMMRRLGGIRVDRSQSQNMVDAMVQEFAKRDKFILTIRSEEHTSELQSRSDLVCRLLLEKKKKKETSEKTKNKKKSK